jgi:hypothetical protein
MKKYLILAALFTVMPLASAQAAMYAGFDLTADSINLSNTALNLYPEAAIGPGVHIGDRFGNFAVELGYGTTRNSLQQADLRFNRLTADGIYYLPLGGFLNLLATAGMSETNFGTSTFTEQTYLQDNITKTTRVATTLLHGNTLDWRAGTGLSFALGDGYEFHVMGHYEPLSAKGLANYALSVNAGFNIAF